MLNSRLTPRWLTPNENWSCRKLHSTKKSMLGSVLNVSFALTGCLCTVQIKILVIILYYTLLYPNLWLFPKSASLY